MNRVKDRDWVWTDVKHLIYPHRATEVQTALAIILLYFVSMQINSRHNDRPIYFPQIFKADNHFMLASVKIHGR